MADLDVTIRRLATGNPHVKQTFNWSGTSFLTPVDQMWYDSAGAEDDRLTFVFNTGRTLKGILRLTTYRSHYPAVSRDTHIDETFSAGQSYIRQLSYPSETIATEAFVTTFTLEYIPDPDPKKYVLIKNGQLIHIDGAILTKEQE